jgi:hypothetical protein
MGAGAQLSVTDLRRSTRHPVDFRVIGEHRQLGDVHLHIVNLSAHGFMAQADDGAAAGGVFGLGRGERLVIRLPHVGRIEAHLIWTTEDRAGFQFERIIRVSEFSALIDALQPNPRLRARR